MPLPSMLTYNELDGSEVSLILEGRFKQILQAVPYLQRHLTLPRVRMKMDVTLEVWADQPSPDIMHLADRLELAVEGAPAPVAAEAETFRARSVDTAAPIEGGHTPGEIREMHGLAIPQPGPGLREVGGHMYTADQYAPELEGREVEVRPGLRISRTGSGNIDGMQGPRGATIIKMDEGPAGLAAGRMDRENFGYSKGKK